MRSGARHNTPVWTGNCNRLLHNRERFWYLQLITTPRDMSVTAVFEKVLKSQSCCNSCCSSYHKFSFFGIGDVFKSVQISMRSETRVHLYDKLGGVLWNQTSNQVAHCLFLHVTWSFTLDVRKLFESGGVGVPSTRNVKKNRRIRDENKNRSHPCHIRSFRFRPELPG